MKFCRTLSQVVKISNEDWAPFWLNYKLLKKQIRHLPAAVHADDSVPKCEKVPSSEGALSQAVRRTTTTTAICDIKDYVLPTSGNRNTEIGTEPSADPTHSLMNTFDIDKDPREVTFFKTLHSEAKRAALFFDKTKQELKIREERILMGFEILKQAEAYSPDTDKWVCMSKSVYKLYKDLLLLETYAIMTYCGFSKILKKHDKNTGYSTQAAFMKNVVDKSSFAAYPDILKMIQHSEALYEEASKKLVSLGKAKLCDDERLFLDMIVQLNKRTTHDLENDNNNNNNSDDDADDNEGGLIIGPAEESASSSELTSALLHSLVTNSLHQNSPRTVSTVSVSGIEGHNDAFREEDSGIIRPESIRSLKRSSEGSTTNGTRCPPQPMKKHR